MYFTGDRYPFGSKIAKDAVRSLYDHLINLDFESKENVIDLYLYSRGGNVSVPLGIASMVREFCEEFNILIPYKAHRTVTLLSLEALGREGNAFQQTCCPTGAFLCSEIYKSWFIQSEGQ